MRPARLHIFTAIVFALAAAGCTDDAKTATPPVGATTASTPAAPASTAAGMDAETKAACTNLTKDIKDVRKDVADAEKIGPPAGHFAVSAAWSAAAASFISHRSGANEAVSKVVDDVTDAMSEIADKYDSPKSKPDKTAVNRALDELKQACSAS